MPWNFKGKVSRDFEDLVYDSCTFLPPTASWNTPEFLYRIRRQSQRNVCTVCITILQANSQNVKNPLIPWYELCTSALEKQREVSQHTLVSG
jgi:hypothetical protein